MNWFIVRRMTSDDSDPGAGNAAPNGAGRHEESIMAALTRIPSQHERTSMARPLAIVIAAHVAFVVVMGGAVPALLSGVISALSGLSG